jgi:transposase
MGRIPYLMTFRFPILIRCSPEGASIARADLLALSLLVAGERAEGARLIGARVDAQPARGDLPAALAQRRLPARGHRCRSIVLSSLRKDIIERRCPEIERSAEMPKILRARPAQDEQEARSVRKLAASRHGPADWIAHAKMVVRSWEGARVEAIAAELHCSPLTARRRLHRFDAEGFEGLGDRSRAGRPRRLTTDDDSALIALVHTAPPGRLVTQRDGTMVARDEEAEAQWSLSALARAAKEAGIAVKRSQIRRILLREGVRWRGTHSWGEPRDKDFAPKEPRSSVTT